MFYFSKFRYPVGGDGGEGADFPPIIILQHFLSEDKQTITTVIINY